MKAIIIGAGPVSKPKKSQSRTFLKLCGLPLLKRTLYLLRTVEIREVIVLLKENNDQIKREIKNLKDLGMRLKFVEKEKWSRAISSLQKEMKDDFFLLIDSHCVFELNLLRVLLQCKKTTLCCDSQPEGSCLTHSPKVFSRDGKVERIGNDLDNWNKVYTGMGVCRKRVLLKLRDKLLEEENQNSGKKNQLPGPRNTEKAEWFTLFNDLPRRTQADCLDISQTASYDLELRRVVKPFWYRIASEEDLKVAKKKLIGETQKKTLDVMAWYVHRPIENKITWYLSELPLTPNQLTILTNVLAFFITFLFLKGYLLAASLLTFLVNIMDGLDGKQARAKGMFTKVGNLEHSLDTLYEVSWYIAFSWAIFMLTKSFLPLKLCLIMILFDAFNRHCSMQFRAVMKTPLADYAPFDRAFRRFDGRRNIYTIYIFIGVILGLPVYSLFAMMVHAILTGVVYFIRAAKHMHAADIGR